MSQPWDTPACGQPVGPRTPDQAGGAAERWVFFYGGMCRLKDGGCDVLQLQYGEVEMGIDRLAVAGPFARELVDYVAADRARIDAR